MSIARSDRKHRLADDRGQSATEALGSHRNPNEKFIVTLEEILHRGPHNPCTGAAQAWDPRLFELYGPFPDWYHTGDLLLPFWGAMEGGTAFISETLTYFRVTGDNTGLGSQYMMAEDDERLRIDDEMHADTVMHLVLMLRTLQERREHLSEKFDYASLEKTLAQNLFGCAVQWSDTHEVLVRRQAKAA